MTIGEKILSLRKKHGMSQDELAKRLLVSRQTISLWEKDKTLPTIDNLIRLKEIFNTSVDEILALEAEPKPENEQEKEPKEEPKEEPFEFYRFNYTKSELKELFNLIKTQNLKKPVLITVLLVFAAIIGICDSSYKAIIIPAIYFLFIMILSIIGILRKFNKINIDRVSETTYEYSVFDNHIKFISHYNNEKIRDSKFYFTDIEQVQHLDKWLILVINGQSFIIRKSDLKETSLIYSFMYNSPAKAIKATPPAKLSIASTLLFVCSIASLWGGILLTALLSGLNGLDTNNAWAFYLFTPISISSIILGFKLKAMGYKYKKNVITGFIITFLLCVYGSFCFIF